MAVKSDGLYSHPPFLYDDILNYNKNGLTPNPSQE